VGGFPGAVESPEAADDKSQAVLLALVRNWAMALAQHLAIATVLEFGQELEKTEA